MNSAALIAVCCAITASVGSYRRGGFLASGPAQAPGAPAARPVPEWRSLLSTGHRIGPSDAAVTIIEFGDFECPACAAYARTLDTVRLRHPRDFSVVFHHFPLPYHRFAYPLARAAECSAAQGRFVEFYDAVYAHPESLGVVPINRIGTSINVKNSSLFDQCFGDTARVAVIEADLDIAKRIGVPGTPDIIIDGSLVGTLPRVADIESLIQKHIRARER